MVQSNSSKLKCATDTYIADSPSQLNSAASNVCIVYKKLKNSMKREHWK